MADEKSNSMKAITALAKIEQELEPLSKEEKRLVIDWILKSHASDLKTSPRDFFSDFFEGFSRK